MLFPCLTVSADSLTGIDWLWKSFSNIVDFLFLLSHYVFFNEINIYSKITDIQGDITIRQPKLSIKAPERLVQYLGLWYTMNNKSEYVRN